MVARIINSSLIQKLLKRSVGLRPELCDEFMELTGGIIFDPAYLQLKQIKHHDKSIYDHTLQVAWLSYRLGKLLRLKQRELVRGALLHDFFLYDWRKQRPDSGKLHAFEHPLVSHQNAVKYFSPITEIERDIILKHMWPLTLFPPKYPESFLVCMVDKYIATREFARDLGNRSRNNR